MPFGEDMRSDVEAVLNASALLEITEFEVFRIAYRGWFGRRAADSVIEPFFTDYMDTRSTHAAGPSHMLGTASQSGNS